MNTGNKKMNELAARNVFALYPNSNNPNINQQQSPFFNTSMPNNINAESALADVLRGNGDAAVVCMAMAENGFIFVSGCANGRGYVWRTDVGDSIKLYCELVGHQSYIRDILVFYPQVLTASGDGTVKKWHLPSKQLVQTWRGHDGPITTMALLGGSVFTASLDETAILWDYNNGTPIARLRGHTGPIGCLSMIPADPMSKTTNLAQGNMADLLVTGSADTTVRLWHLQTGQLVQILGYVYNPGPQNSGGEVDNAGPSGAFQPISDNSYHRGPVTTLAFVRSAQLLCSGSSDCTIRGWTAPNWICVIVLDRHSAPISHLQAPNEDMLYSAGADGAVHAWTFEMQMAGLERQLVPVAHLQTTFSPFDERSSRIYNKNIYQEPIIGMGYAAASINLPIGHPRNPMSYIGLPGDERQPVETVTSFCKVGRFLVVGAMDGTVCCYDELGAIVRRLNGHTSAVTACRNLMDRFVLTASVDGTIRVWNRSVLFSQVSPVADMLQMGLGKTVSIPMPMLPNKTRKTPSSNYSQSLPTFDHTTRKLDFPLPAVIQARNKFNKGKSKTPMVFDDDDSGTEVADLRTIATQTKQQVGRKKSAATITVNREKEPDTRKNKPKVITIYQEKTPPVTPELHVEEDEEPSPQIIVIPKRFGKARKAVRKEPAAQQVMNTPAPVQRSEASVPPKLKEPAAPTPAVRNSMPQFDPTYFAMRDHQRELALMSMAAEVAVERALRLRHPSVANSLGNNTSGGRLSLPPVAPLKTDKQLDKRPESRAWSLPSARHQVIPDDDDEYFQELDYSPSQVLGKK